MTNRVDRRVGALVYLHGHGSSAAQVPERFRTGQGDGWARVLPDGPIVVDGGFAWFENGSRGVDRPSLDQAVEGVSALIDGLVRDLGVAPSQVVLGGFSQGAATALAVAIERGRRGEVPLGGLLLQAGFLPECFDDELELADAAADRVLIVHPQDDDVVPAFLAKDLVDSLGAADRVGAVTFTTVVGGHAIGDEMTDVSLDWLRAI